MLHILRLRWLRELLATIAVLVAGFALVAAPEQAIQGGKNGLLLCFNVIIPSLFPFFVLSSLVVDLGLASCLGSAMGPLMRPLFRVNGSCSAAVVLGFIGGYPVGARTALQLYQQGLCSKAEAERLLAFCNNSGPAFIFGVVGAGVFGDGRVGLLLYLTHTLASILVGILFRFHGGGCAGAPSQNQKPIGTITVPAAFTGAVTRSFQSTLNICAFVVFFSVVLQMLTAWGALSALADALGVLGLSPEWAHRLVAGLLELSSGVSSLSGGTGLAGRASMAAFMLGWAGLSVHCQVLSFLLDSGLSVRTYLAGKLCHALLAAALTWLCAQVIPISQSVSHYLIQQTETIAALDFSTALTISAGAAVGCWLLLCALGTALVRKKCGKGRRNRVY